jgi:hypothetical protein
MVSSVYAERHILALYSDCHYAECRYVECRGASQTSFEQCLGRFAFLSLNFIVKSPLP